MDGHSAFEAWLFSPYLWVFAALLLVGADMVFGLEYFVLSIGVAALVMAALLYLQDRPWAPAAPAIESWRGVGVWFAGLTVASVAAIRLLFQRRGGPPDPNEY